MAPRSHPRELVHLDAAAVVAIHAEVISAHGGRPGIRDRALLESAVAAPQASHAGTPLIADVIGIAAAYLFYLSRNHPFIDGNKRTALAACLVFLQVNGRLPEPSLPSESIDEWEALAWDVAASGIDRVEVTRRLRRLLGPAQAQPKLRRLS